MANDDKQSPFALSTGDLIALIVVAIVIVLVTALLVWVLF